MDSNKQNREEILEKQCAYYIRQIRESAQWMEELRKLRHNMKQHYMLENIYLERQDYEALKRYCNENLAFLDNKKSISNSGNSYIDSVINYKADMAAKEGIRLMAEIQVPLDVEMDAGDICICLGNLLDNAIEAAADLDKGKAIRVRVMTEGSNMVINIKNQYKDRRHKKEGCYLTSKNDDREHGLGLLSVQQIVEKYDGSMVICDENNMFDVMVLMYGFLDKK